MTLGMGMTEKQGGTDVRANTTRAEPRWRCLPHHRPQVVHVGADVRRVPGAGAGAGRADLFLHAAVSPGRQRQRAAFPAAEGQARQPLQRLVGGGVRRRLCASRVGEEGAGIRTILPMVQLTRLDCAISSAGMMRAGWRGRCIIAAIAACFGKRLTEQPMMRAVLADMAIEVEGALAAVMRLCRSFDLAASVPSEAARARLLTPAIKYWVCKTAPALVVRGDGVPRRQRLRRGERAGAALPRGAGQRDLGGLGQRDGRSTCCACSAAIPRLRERRCRNWRVRRAACPARRTPWTLIDKTLADGTGEAQRPLCRRTAGAACGRSGAQGAARRRGRGDFCAHAAVGQARGDLRHQRFAAAETTSLLARVLPDC